MLVSDLNGATARWPQFAPAALDAGLRPSSRPWQAALLAEQLEGALNTRIVIEQARGVLSERLGTDLDEVFSRLRRYPRNHNRR